MSKGEPHGLKVVWLTLFVTCSTLKKWRSQGLGPAYAKIGGSVLYRPVDLDSYVESMLVA